MEIILTAAATLCALLLFRHMYRLWRQSRPTEPDLEWRDDASDNGMEDADGLDEFLDRLHKEKEMDK